MLLSTTTTAKGGEKMKNLDIRKAIERNNIKYWQIADKLGITDGNFSRLLRKELEISDKEVIFNIIKELKEDKEKWKITKSTIQKKTS